MGIIDYLDEAFDEKEKLLKKINIPMVVLMADIAIKEAIEPYEFHDWFLYFFVSNKEYSQYCSSGSIKKEKVLGRLTTMEAHFTKHFKLDAPAEAEALESDEEIPETDSTDTSNLEESEISTEETAKSEDNKISTEEISESEESETSTEENESEEEVSQEETDSFMNPPADAESEEAPTNEDCYLVEQGA